MMSTNDPQLFDREDEVARSWQDDTLQLGKKVHIRTYIKVTYSSFIIYKYIWDLSRADLLDSKVTVL